MGEGRISFIILTKFGALDPYSVAKFNLFVLRLVDETTSIIKT